MSATGEPQSLPPKLDFLELAGLLQLKVAGEPFPYSFIHEVSPYSADPEDLVRGRDPAPGTDGKRMKWYFCSAPNFHQSAGGAPRRNRQVGGGQERRFWRPEGRKIPIRGPDEKPVGAYWRTLSYVHKTMNLPAAAKPFRDERLGWCMLEVGLQQQEGDQVAGQQWEICKVYRSPLPPSPSTAAAGEDVYAAPRTGASGVEDSANRRGMSGADNTCPTPPPAASSRDNQTILLTSSADIVLLKSNITMLEIQNKSSLGHNAFIIKTLSIFQGWEISVDCMTTSEGKMSLALVPSEHLRGKLLKLAIDNAVEELEEYAGVHRQERISVISLTGNARMSSFILEKALGVLRSINVKVQKSLQDPSKVAHVSLVVPDSVAEDCVQALLSEFHYDGFVPQVHGAEKDPAVSSSGLKRKAVGKAAPGESLEMAGITDPSSSVLVQTGNDPVPPMAAGVLEDEDNYSFFFAGEDDYPLMCDQADGAHGITPQEMESILLSNNHNNASPLVNDDIMLDGVTRPDAINSDLDDGLKFGKTGRRRACKKSLTELLFGFREPQQCKKSLTQHLVGFLAEDFVAAIRSLTGCCCWAKKKKKNM